MDINVDLTKWYVFMRIYDSVFVRIYDSVFMRICVKSFLRIVAYCYRYCYRFRYRFHVIPCDKPLNSVG